MNSQPSTPERSDSPTASTIAPPFVCPVCGAGQHRQNAKCIRCGIVILSEAKDLLSGGSGYADTGRMPLAGPPLSRAAWRALGIGFGLAAIIWVIPFTRILFDPLGTIIHELGHAATAWSFGYQAIPAFDFSEGGGATMIPEERSVPVVIGVYGLFAFLIWRVRRHLPSVIAILVFAVAHALLSQSYMHRGVITGMGHGMTLVFSAVFLYRAMTGTTLLQADERPAYAMVGFLMVFDNVSFFHRLANDLDFQAWYMDGKSYADNDLVRIADSFWNTSVPRMAQIFFLVALLMPLVARLFYRLEGPMWLWASRFRAPK